MRGGCTTGNSLGIGTSRLRAYLTDRDASKLSPQSLGKKLAALDVNGQAATNMQHEDLAVRAFSGKQIC